MFQKEGLLMLVRFQRPPVRAGSHIFVGRPAAQAIMRSALEGQIQLTWFLRVLNQNLPWRLLKKKDKSAKLTYNYIVCPGVSLFKPEVNRGAWVKIRP